MSADQIYDRRALLHAYLRAKSNARYRRMPGDEEGRSRDDRDAALLAGLERLFGITIDPVIASGEQFRDERVILRRELGAAADAYVSLTTSWCGDYVEGSPNAVALENAGLWREVSGLAEGLRQATSTAAELYFSVMDVLLRHLLGDRAEETFAEAELANV